VNVIDNLQVAATRIGKITATVQGLAGLTACTLISDSSFTSSGSIGDITATGKSKNPATNFTGLIDSSVTAAGTVGKIKAANFTRADVFAGGSSASIATDSGTTAAAGTIRDSSSLAGNTTVLAKDSDLAKAGIGSIKTSGLIQSSTFAAKGSLGSVKLGGDADQLTLVAGIATGGDRAILTNDDTYNRHGSIGAIAIAGALRSSSIVAGINPGSDQMWGAGTGAAADTAGGATAGLKTLSKIAAIIAGASTVAPGVTSPLKSPALLAHLAAIESLSLASIQIGKLSKTTDFSAPLWLDADGNGVEDADEILIRMIS
jgi:hypothetical protein